MNVEKPTKIWSKTFVLFLSIWRYYLLNGTRQPTIIYDYPSKFGHAGAYPHFFIISLSIFVYETSSWIHRNWLFFSLSIEKKRNAFILFLCCSCFVWYICTHIFYILFCGFVIFIDRIINKENQPTIRSDIFISFSSDYLYETQRIVAHITKITRIWCKEQYSKTYSLWLCYTMNKILIWWDSVWRI